MREKFEIPDSWEMVRLGDFVNYQKGRKPILVEKMQSDRCPLPYVNIKAFEKSIIDEFANGAGCVFCEDGDFLMVWDGARSGYVGKAIKGVLGSTLMKIDFPGIHAAYAFYYLKSKYLQINTKAKGTGIPHVDPNILWNYDFPISPLPEQYRIVAKIEELFSSLDKGIESLKTAQQQLKIYRQSVLDKAFKVRNTNKSGNDKKHATRWTWISLKAACEIIGGVTKGRDFKGKPTVLLPYLRVANVQDGYLDLNEIRMIEALPSDLEKYRLQYGDILYTEGGDKDKLGRGTIWKNEVENCIHQNHIFRARPKSNEYNSNYISYYSQSKSAKDYFYKNGKQTTNLASINLTILSELPIPMPPSLEEQQFIVSEIERRLSVCDKLEESINQGLQQAEVLRQSILKKAFAGQLVPQDPNDEPAAVLLERIKAEREAAKPDLRRTRNKKSKKDRAA
jgi:type I restriction enzyme S subunit